MAKTGVGIIGTGDMGQSHIRVLSSFKNEAVIKAIYEPNQERARTAINICGDPQVSLSNSSRELVSRKDIDAVIVASPNYQHCTDALAAIEAGKDCFCEKPLATSLQDCFRINAAVKKSDIVFQVGLVYRYSTLFNKMAELIRSGTIGEPRMAWCHEFRVPFPVGRGREWRYVENSSGGTLVEKNCHHFDLFSWMFGCKAMSVFAVGGDDVVKTDGPILPGVPGEPYDYRGPSDVIDSSWVVLEYESGARACLGLCMYVQDRDLPFGVIGTKGWIEGFVKRQELTWRIYDEQRTFSEKFDDTIVAAGDERYIGHPGGVRQIKEFLASVRERTKPFCSLDVAIDSMVIAFAAEKSLKKHECVDTTEIINEVDQELIPDSVA